MSVEAGADAVKVGVGLGFGLIRTTCFIFGVGVPRISTVANIAKELGGTGKPPGTIEWE